VSRSLFKLLKHVSFQDQHKDKNDPNFFFIKKK
jgi:hypothetical protein